MFNLGYGSFYYSTLDALELAGSNMLSATHPDYRVYKPDWDRIRTALAGERRMKEKGELYLPPMGSSRDNYATYKDRAVYTNYALRSLTGMTGLVLSRPIEAINAPSAFDQIKVGLTADGQGLQALGLSVVRELLSLGRVGALIDRTEDGSRVYASLYLAENILSWATELRNGVEVPVYVFLREIYDAVRKDAFGVLHYGGVNTSAANATSLRARYRILRLDEQGYYEQIVLNTPESAHNVNGATDATALVVHKIIQPTKNGQRLTYIPFECAGLQGLGLRCERPTLIDIVNLNIHHYRTSAHLEHGRFYTASPVYFVPVPESGEDQAEYVVDSAVVWEVPPDSKPGILEYYGTGLAALKVSLDEKEGAIEKLSGMAPNTTSSGSENVDVYRSKQAADLAVLSAAATSTTLFLTKIVGWMLDWDNIPAEGMKIQVNQSFRNAVSARELRAVAVLYERGLLPIDEVFTVFRDNGYIHPETTLEKFKEMLSDKSQFPNNPDVDARREGYADSRARMDDKNKAADRDQKDRAQTLALAAAETEDETEAETEDVESTSPDSDPA